MGDTVLRVQTMDELLDSTDALVAGNIRSCRQAAGMTQSELAEQATGRGWAIDNTAVARIEAGRRSLRAGQLALLAEILRVPVERFFESDRRARTVMALSSAKRALGAVEWAVLQWLDARRELEVDLEEPGALDEADQRVADALLVADLPAIVRTIVDAPSEAGVRASGGRLRDDRTYSGRELEARVAAMLGPL